MSKDIIGTGTCPGCSKQLRVPLPYNVDLHRNTPIVICSRCGKHIPVRFVTGTALDKVGDLQGIFRILEVK